MSKAPGIFIQLKTTIIHDDKLAAAGPEATCLYVKGLCWAKEHLTDGEVRRGALAILGAGISDPEAAAQRLVDNHLWTVTENGWTVGSERWARHQETKAQVDARREADRERKKAGKKVTKKVAKTTKPKASGIREDSGRNPSGSKPESATSRDGFQHTDTYPETETETESPPPRASKREPEPAAPGGGGGECAGFEGDLDTAVAALTALRVNRATSHARQAGSERAVLYAIERAREPGVKNRAAMAVQLIRDGEKPPAGWRSRGEIDAASAERNRQADRDQAVDLAQRKREYERNVAEIALIKAHQDIAMQAAEQVAKGDSFSARTLRSRPKRDWVLNPLCRAEVLDAIEKETGDTVEALLASGRESA
jgi:hypothetical protein